MVLKLNCLQLPFLILSAEICFSLVRWRDCSGVGMQAKISVQFILKHTKEGPTQDEVKYPHNVFVASKFLNVKL